MSSASPSPASRWRCVNMSITLCHSLGKWLPHRCAGMLMKAKRGVANTNSIFVAHELTGQGDKGSVTATEHDVHTAFLYCANTENQKFSSFFLLQACV